jgi:O-antigen ligase
MMVPAAANAIALPQTRTAETTTPGVWVLGLFLYLSYSRIADLVFVGLHIPLITSVLALLFAIATGGIRRALSSRIGIWLTAYCAWIVIAIPFSFWRGGSFQLLIDQWLKSFMVFLLVAGLLRTARDCRIAMYALAFAGLTVVGLALSLGTTELYGRLMVAEGVLSNSNDLAQLLLLCLPFVLFVCLGGRSAIGRVIGLIALFGSLAVVGQTGSRGGLLTVCGMFLFLFFTVNWASRAKLIAALVVAAVVVVPFIPPAQWERFSTILGDESEAPLEAVGSKESRIELFKQSVTLTLQNPIFGVGPGVFDAAAARYSEDRGERAIWRVTHNSYTQVSSETGFPGFIFYLGTLLASFRAVRRTYRESKERALPTVNAMSYYLALTLVAYSISTVFSSVAYHIYLPTLAGFSVALQHALMNAAQPDATPIRTVPGVITPPSRAAGSQRPVPI